MTTVKIDALAAGINSCDSHEHTSLWWNGHACTQNLINHCFELSHAGNVTSGRVANSLSSEPGPLARLTWFTS